ncbi:IS5 family transposase [Nocardiopsis sp. CNT-189]|uniref:IS5 family transposase n=1 Tax=Nocardiopsis oceanisediminis TaxID=2816862 RepID=UPI003B372F13
MCNCKPGEDARPCYPSSLSDAAWAVIEPLMPARDWAKGGAPRRYGDRLVLDAIFFVLHSGCQWRMIPADLPPWDADGTLDRIHGALRARVRAASGRDPNPSAAVLDSQTILTGQGGQARGYDAGKRTRGRKRHLITDTLGPVPAVAVTSASVQDRPGGRRVLEVPAAHFPSIGLVWADAGYANQVDDSLLTWAHERFRLMVEIVRRSDGAKGFEALPRRWVVANRRLRGHGQDRDDPVDGRTAGRSEAAVEQPLCRPGHLITRIPNSHSGVPPSHGGPPQRSPVPESCVSGGLADDSCEVIGGLIDVADVDDL